LVSAVESHSDHPLASALVEGAQERLGSVVSIPTAQDVKEHCGGIQATVDGETVYVAKPVFFSEFNGAKLPAEQEQANKQLMADGRTTMVVLSDTSWRDRRDGHAAEGCA
jgi:Cd2+/Zn2+-exporting ATPase